MNINAQMMVFFLLCKAKKKKKKEKMQWEINIKQKQWGRKNIFYWWNNVVIRILLLFPIYWKLQGDYGGWRELGSIICFQKPCAGCFQCYLTRSLELCNGYPHPRTHFLFVDADEAS